MDGLSRCLGSPVDVRLAGRDFWVLPLTLGRLATCEAHLLASRRTPVERTAPLAAMLPPSAKRKVLARACRATLDDPWCNKVRLDEILTWIETGEGLRFTARLCLRSETLRRLSGKAMDRLLGKATLAEVQEYRRRLNLVSGLDVLAELDWPDRGEDGEPLWVKALRQAKGMRAPPRPKQKDGPVPWRRNVADWARSEAGWDWRVLSRMTVYQYQLYVTDPEKLSHRGSGQTEAMPVAYAVTKTLWDQLGDNFKPDNQEQRAILRLLKQGDKVRRLEAHLQEERARAWAERLAQRLEAGEPDDAA